MKRRVCIVGNSHVAALKQGWDDLKHEYPDADITFFAAPGRYIGQTALRDGAIIATSDYTGSFFERLGGSDAIVLDRFDDFVVVGCSIHIGRFLELMQENRPLRYLDGEALRRFARKVDDSGASATGKRRPARQSLLQRVAGLFRKSKAGGARASGRESRNRRDNERKAPAGGGLVSYAVFREMVFSAFKATNAARLIDAASRRDGRRDGRREGLRIFYISTPFPSVGVIDTARGKNFARLIAAGGAQDAACRYWELLDAYLAPRAILIRQPPETVENHILTRAEFSRDSVGLAPTGEKHPDEELKHMNAAYGCAMMKAVLAAIAAKPSR